MLSNQSDRHQKYKNKIQHTLWEYNQLILDSCSSRSRLTNKSQLKQRFEKLKTELRNAENSLFSDYYNDCNSLINIIPNNCEGKQQNLNASEIDTTLPNVNIQKTLLKQYIK